MNEVAENRGNRRPESERDRMLTPQMPGFGNDAANESGRKGAGNGESIDTWEHEAHGGCVPSPHPIFLVGCLCEGLGRMNYSRVHRGGRSRLVGGRYMFLVPVQTPCSSRGAIFSNQPTNKPLV